MTINNAIATSTRATQLRAHALRMVHAVNASHIGTCLSMADLLAVLYGGILNVHPSEPQWPNRDRLILSKGHGAAILYAALAEAGFFAVDELATYCQKGSQFTGHISHHIPGVEVSTGSLGHGLSFGTGMALASKADGLNWRVFVILSDGELDEGSNWEPILLAPHLKLDNLIAIVDYNKIQSFGRVDEVLPLEPLKAKWEAFGWEVQEVDGHDHQALHATLGTIPFKPGKPSVVIAHTIKGKGVSFMENELAWHYRSPNELLLEQALAELGCNS